MLTRRWIGLGALLLTLTACSQNSQNPTAGPLPGPETGIRATEATTLTVTNVRGEALAGASVLIGTEAGRPFAGNFLKTDANGTFTAPAEWTTAQMVTIAAPGFIRTTFVGQMPEGQTFQVRLKEGTGRFELSGVTEGFQIKNGDGLVDFALVMPAFTKRDLFSFDASNVVSSETDQISIIGQKVDLPANISLPKQREKYIIPISVEKPRFRVPFRSKGTQKVVALRGQFPLKPVVDGIRAGKKFIDLINFFSVTGGSVQNVAITGDVTKDLPVDQLTFNQARTMKAPDYRSDVQILTVAFAKTQGYLYPTDVKAVEPRRTQEMRLASSDSTLLTVGKLKSELNSDHPGDRVTATILPFTNNVQPSLLPVMENPRLLSDDQIQIPAVTPVAGIAKSGTYATLSEVIELGTPDAPMEQLRTRWEVYAPEWVREVQLPRWPSTSDTDETEDFAPRTDSKMRWGVTLIGRSSKVEGDVDLGPGLLETATHATHSSVDF